MNDVLKQCLKNAYTNRINILLETFFNAAITSECIDEAVENLKNGIEKANGTYKKAEEALSDESFEIGFDAGGGGGKL